jgi:ParB/RepB/Spo0J family partition protein
MADNATTANPQPETDENPEERKAIAAAQAAGEMIRDLPVASVAPDPENPKSRLNPDPDFVASMKLGQLSPGVVVRLDVWAAQGNDVDALYVARAEGDGADPEADPDAYAEAIAKAKAETEYVIVFGHRRWAGAKAAGNATYKAVVTEDIKDRTTQRIQRVMENVHRADLSPLEEAHEYQRLIKDGLSQRELTRRTGIPQSQISRRLGLIKLPKQAQEALETGAITVEVANALITFATERERVQRVLDVIAKMPATTDEEKEARTRAAKDAAQTEARAAEAAKAQAKKRAELKKRGIPLIEDREEYFAIRPGHRYQYQILGNDNVDKALAEGTVMAWVASGGIVEWYTTKELEKPSAQPALEPKAEEPATAAPDATDTTGMPAETGTPAPAARKTPAPQEPQETEEQRRAREEREHVEHEIHTAAMARDGACLRIVSKVPNRDQLTARLSRRLLLGEDTEDLEAQKLTIEWLRAAGVIPAEATVYALFGDHDNIDPKVAARAAYGYDLALDEIRTRASDVYDSADVRHIERLIKEAGYEPTTWEQAHMDALNKTN